MAAWNLVLYKPHCCVVCAATKWMAERLMSVMAVGVAMLRYSKIKKDQILCQYTAFANEIVCVSTYVHCTHESTNYCHLIAPDWGKQDTSLARSNA